MALSMIEHRMLILGEFTFARLHAGYDSAYRPADRAIQRWRKKGWINMRRQGRDVIWTVTPEGRRAAEEAV